MQYIQCTTFQLHKISGKYTQYILDTIDLYIYYSLQLKHSLFSKQYMNYITVILSLSLTKTKIRYKGI